MQDVAGKVAFAAVEHHLGCRHIAAPGDGAVAVEGAAYIVRHRVAEVAHEVEAWSRDVEGIDIGRLGTARVALMIVMRHDVALEVEDVDAGNVEPVPSARVLEGDVLPSALHDGEIALHATDAAGRQAEAEDAIGRLPCRLPTEGRACPAAIVKARNFRRSGHRVLSHRCLQPCKYPVAGNDGAPGVAHHFGHLSAFIRADSIVHRHDGIHRDVCLARQFELGAQIV